MSARTLTMVAFAACMAWLIYLVIWYPVEGCNASVSGVSGCTSIDGR